jgi:hypothetical protein
MIYFFYYLENLENDKELLASCISSQSVRESQQANTLISVYVFHHNPYGNHNK